MEYLPLSNDVDIPLRNHPAGYVKFNGITLNESAYEAHYQFKAIPLTPKEFSMLGLLLQNLYWQKESGLH